MKDAKKTYVPSPEMDELIDSFTLMDDTFMSLFFTLITKLFSWCSIYSSTAMTSWLRRFRFRRKKRVR